MFHEVVYAGLPERRPTAKDEAEIQEKTDIVICAIYARKSTDQTGVAEDQKSVARQIEHARAYAAVKTSAASGGEKGSA